MYRLLAACCLLIGLGAAEQPLCFTAIPDQDSSRLHQRFAAVADYLAEQLGRDVRYVPVKSYAASVAAFANDDVQLAWFGALTGIQARQAVPGSQALAQGAEDTAFRTYVIAHQDTGLEPTVEFPAAIAGRSFTFGSKASTSGRLMPEYWIRQHFAEDPAQVFRRLGYSGDHSTTIALVAAGSYEVGAVNYAVWERMKAEDPTVLSTVRVLWQTPPYPDYHWTIRGDVDARYGAGFSARVQAALLALDDPDLLARFPRSAFVPATNADYQVIEQVALDVGLLRP
jgi:phosphonate transport system substrate-binding protein